MRLPLLRRARASALLTACVISLMYLVVRTEPSASAQSLHAVTPSVDVVKVQGVIDPANAGYVRGTIQAAEEAGATVILQLDSRGSFGSQADDLGRFLRSADVPVVTWVGATGARAAGGALFLLYGSSLATMAPGAGVGPARPFDLAVTASREPAADMAAGTASLSALAPGAGAKPEAIAEMAAGAVFPAQPALDAGAVSLVAPDIPDLLRQLDGVTVQTSRGPVTLATLNRPGRPVNVRFHEIGPVRRLLHGVSTPTAVYVLLLLGFWGVAFELTQPGFGVAGIGGVLALALAVYGLTVVPVHWLGIAVLSLGVGLQALDVLLRRLGPLTFVGTALFAAGSVLAWWGVAPAVDVAWWLIVLATIADFLIFGFGMTVALRARERVRSQQVGLVGLVGEAHGDLDPQGAVSVKGTLWRARTSDGPIPKGSRVRVRGVDGLILRVDREPD